MAEGNVFHATHGGTCVIRFEGAISYTLGNALDRFLDDLFARGEFTSIVVDLCDTESIDSTGLGLLARIANFVRRRDGSKPLLFSSRPDINVLLSSICLDEVFVLCAQLPERVAGQALPAGNASESELAQTVLDAHRVLCAMNDSNRAMFQNVVDAFERDLGQR
jgi:anti-anti-sigma factor